MEVPVPVGLGIIAAVLFLAWQFHKRRMRRIDAMPRIPRTLPAGGFEVPVFASFAESEGSPGLAIRSHNEITPALTLFEDHLECRVLRRQAVPYREIEKIDIVRARWARNLRLYADDGESVYTLNLRRDRNLAEVLRFLHGKGIPLSARAGAWLATQAR